MTPDKPWKAAERTISRILHGRRVGPTGLDTGDVEAPGLLAEVKHRKTYTFPQAERDLATVKRRAGKDRQGVLVYKRRAGQGKRTPWLLIIELEEEPNAE